ncbi:hypothetical protein H5A44_23015, partial [Pectobacterium brasiliense]|uniref:hypothetical protein n=1 Tax=Pectobacterium brasiliense TaxID=180957 RepID=UPI00196A061A
LKKKKLIYLNPFNPQKKKPVKKKKINCTAKKKKKLKTKTPNDFTTTGIYPKPKKKQGKK